MSTTVTSTADLINRRLQIHKVIAMDRPGEADYEMHKVKRDMAMALADKIMEKDDFFNLRYEDLAAYGTRMMIVNADCIVITQQEFYNLMRDQFAKGVHHATGFMPRDY